MAKKKKKVKRAAGSKKKVKKRRSAATKTTATPSVVQEDVDEFADDPEMVDPTDPNNAIAPLSERDNPPTSLMRTMNKRMSRVEVNRRRSAVWESYCAGVTIHRIATELGVPYDTVKRDVLWWRRRHGQYANSLKKPGMAAADIGTSAAMLMQVAQEARLGFLEVTKHEHKVKYLSALTRAVESRYKLLSSAGYLPRIGFDITVQPDNALSFAARFGEDSAASVLDDKESRRKVLEAAEAIFQHISLTGDRMLEDDIN